MLTWISDFLAMLQENPYLQGAVVALLTFILEDPVTIGSGLMVAEGGMTFVTAFLGLSIGIALGDFGLYGLGRWLGPKTVSWGLVQESRLKRAGGWFRRNAVGAILLSRFVPGMRLPTYLGAGLFRMSALKFLGVAVPASIVWTYLLLVLTITVGESVLPLLGRWKWPVALAAVIAFALLQWFLGRRAQKDNQPEFS